MPPILQEVKRILHQTIGRLRQTAKRFSTHGLTFALMLMLVGTAAFASPTTVAGAKSAKSARSAKKLGVATKRPKIIKFEKAKAKRVADGPQLPPTLTDKTENLNPVLLKRFDAFRTFIFQNYGVVLEINSGYRSTEEQAYLYRTLPRGMANPPGVSLHEKGEAVDYRPASPNYNQHLPTFGLKAPFPGIEDWHLERADN